MAIGCPVNRDLLNFKKYFNLFRKHEEFLSREFIYFK